jgi:hypothetical protein
MAEGPAAGLTGGGAQWAQMFQLELFAARAELPVRRALPNTRLRPS